MIDLKRQSVCPPDEGWVEERQVFEARLKRGRYKRGNGSHFAESGVLAAACLPGTGVALMKSRERE